MSTASLENCEKLYKLSGWTDKSLEKHGYYSLPPMVAYHETDIPAYPLGYLLRKLPKATDINTDKWEESFDCSIPEMFFMAWEMDTMDHKWRVQMQVEDEVLEPILFEADNPEDAACLLLIRLFEEGILVKE